MLASRRLVFAVVGLAVAAAAMLVLDDYALRIHVKRTMSAKRSTVTEEDRVWWERHVGPVPGERDPKVNVVLPGITGGPALPGSRFRWNGEAGEDGASADASEWRGMGPFEAADLVEPAGGVRGRMLLSSDVAAYRLTELNPLAIFERDAITRPPDTVENPYDSKAWTRRPRWGLMLLGEAVGVTCGLLLARVVTGRESRRLSAIAARRAASAAEPGRDQFDDRCPGCGHDLHGTDAAQCSECGCVIGPPGGRARLELADPAWRRRVWFGRSIMSGCSRVMVAVIAAIVLLEVLALVVPPVELYYVERAIELLQVASFWCVPTLGVGAFLFVTPDPRERQRRLGWSTSRVVRIAAITLIAIMLLSLAPSWVPTQIRFAGWLITTLGSVLALAVTILGGLRRAGILASRAGAPELARACVRRRRWQLVGAGIATLLAFTFLAYATSKGWVRLPPSELVMLARDLIPSVAMLLVWAVLPGPLGALGREWRVAITTARRERPSGTSASEVPVDSAATSARGPHADPTP